MKRGKVHPDPLQRYDPSQPFYEVSDVLDSTIGRFSDRDEAARFAREHHGIGPWGPLQPGQEMPF